MPKGHKTPHELLAEIEFLFQGYWNESRATTHPHYLQRLTTNIADFHYDPADALVRETLMEHIGSLPVVASALYPYINDKTVNLGEALVMLAIHDIGELITGDEITFIKNAKREALEQAEALKLLHHSYHGAYKDIESQSSQTAKFAKAIDKITGDIFDYLTPPEITVGRYKHFLGIEAEEILPLIREHKRPYMLWNPFMTAFHAVLLDGLDQKIANHLKSRQQLE